MDKVLIIEDDDLIRENLVELFSMEGFEVHQAENGFLGIEKAKKIYPNLILSDIMMAEMNGFTVYKILKQIDEFQLTPFIFLSALNEKENIREGMNLGADDFITKPFENTELINVVKNRIEKTKKVKSSLEELKSNLVRSIPHEFLTPLHGIIGFSELIKDGLKTNEIDKSELIEYANYIIESSNKLSRIINNYILFTELEILSKDHQKKTEIKNEKVQSPNQLIYHYIKEISKKFDREQDIDFQFDEEKPIFIKKNYLEKIITELLDNSLKFSEKFDKINISTFEKNNFLELSISDNGVGMNEAQILKINSFNQFDRSKNEQSGLGLGLFLTKKILEIHEGQFHIKPNLPKGINYSLIFRKG